MCLYACTGVRGVEKYKTIAMSQSGAKRRRSPQEAPQESAVSKIPRSNPYTDFENIPDVMMTMILVFMRPETLIKLQLVCKRLRALLNYNGAFFTNNAIMIDSKTTIAFFHGFMANINPPNVIIAADWFCHRDVRTFHEDMVSLRLTPHVHVDDYLLLAICTSVKNLRRLYIMESSVALTLEPIGFLKRLEVLELYWTMTFEGLDGRNDEELDPTANVLPSLRDLRITTRDTVDPWDFNHYDFTVLRNIFRSNGCLRTFDLETQDDSDYAQLLPHLPETLQTLRLSSRSVGPPCDLSALRRLKCLSTLFLSNLNLNSISPAEWLGSSNLLTTIDLKACELNTVRFQDFAAWKQADVNHRVFSCR